MVLINHGFGLIAVISTLFLPAVSMAHEESTLNIATYLPPPGLLAYLNNSAPVGVEYNESAWVGLSDANFVVYFMSSFDARYEITAFGSEVLDTVEFDPKTSAVVTQSIAHGERTVFAIFVATSQFDGLMEPILCNTANAIDALSVNFTGNSSIEVRNCL